jgi:hypothetical protein
MASSTTIKPEVPLTSDLQAVNPFKLAKLLKKAFEWAKKNWKAVVSFFAGQGISELDSFPKVWSFVSNLLQPNISAEYKSMTEQGKQSVNQASAALAQAFTDGDRTGVISSLQSIADTYESQSKLLNDPEKTKALQDKAKQIRGMADGIANGEIPLDRGISDRVKELDKEEKQEPKVAFVKTNESLQDLNQNLEKLVVKAMTELGINEINSTNSRQVAGELLNMGASSDVAKQALSHHYESTSGLTKAQSNEEAKKDLVSAVADRELSSTTLNNQVNSTKTVSNQRER